MGYTKQTFIPGQKLTAASMNHIENGVASAYEAIAELQQGVGGSTETFNVLVEPSETISAAYLSGKKIYPISGAAYSVDIYDVAAGTEYYLHSDGAFINLEDTMVLFTTDKTVGANAPAEAEAVITFEKTDGVASPKAYAVHYTPAVNGYIAISRVNQNNNIAVYVKGAEEAVLTELKIQVFGDSITAENWGGGNSWVSHLPERFPKYALSIVNSAVGGNTLMELYDENGLYKGVSWQVGLSGTTAGHPDAVGNDQYGAPEHDADIAIVFAGTNDWAGTNRDVSTGGFLSSDEMTIDGAVRAIIEKMSIYHPGTRLLFIAPMQRNNDFDLQQIGSGRADERGNATNQRDSSETWCTLEDVVDSIVDTCRFFGVPCLDLYHEGGFNRLNITTFSDDGLHPNQDGHARLAELISNKILSII